MTILIRSITPPTVLPCVATIGNFDGVHLGHQSLIAILQDLAKETGLPTMVITFFPNPRFFLSNNMLEKKIKGRKDPAQIMTFKEKFLVLQDLGIDFVCVLPFNKNLAFLSPETFMREILIKNLQVKHLIIGEDFRFGKGRQGDGVFLQKEGPAYGLQAKIVPSFMQKGEKVSSTRIRQALARDNLIEAEQLLGRKIEV